MGILHDEHLKLKCLHEPAMDTEYKMMQWDTKDPLLKRKRQKTESQDAHHHTDNT